MDAAKLDFPVQLYTQRKRNLILDIPNKIALSNVNILNIAVSKCPDLYQTESHKSNFFTRIA